MKKQDYDFNNYDRLTIIAKKAVYPEVLSSYAVFGWKEKNKKDDVSRGDIVHVEMLREHKIKNKDELQYLQVCFESELDKLSDAYTYKNAKSKAIAITVSSCAVLFSVLCLPLIFSATTVLNILGYSLISTFLLAPIFSLPLFIKFRKKENKKFNDISGKCIKIIEGILQKAKGLTE